MQRDLDQARRAILRRATTPAMSGDPALRVSSEVARGLRAISGPAAMEGSGWVEVIEAVPVDDAIDDYLRDVADHWSSDLD